MTQTILILDAISEAVAQQMRDHLQPGFELDYATELGDDHLVEIIDQADYAISGQVPVSGRVLRAAKRLKLLHKWGVGVDNIDLEAAREKQSEAPANHGSQALQSLSWWRFRRWRVGLHQLLGRLFSALGGFSALIPFTPVPGR